MGSGGMLDYVRPYPRGRLRPADAEYEERIKTLMAMVTAHNGLAQMIITKEREIEETHRNCELLREIIFEKMATLNRLDGKPL